MKKQTYAAAFLGALLLLPVGLQAATSKHAALFYAARAGQYHTVASLIKQGANVNHFNRFRETPMHAAASKGQVGVMRYLLSKGGRYNLSTVSGWFPLHHAVRFGHVGAAQYLLQLGSPVHARTRDGKSVFDIAAATRNRAMMQLLQRYRR